MDAPELMIVGRVRRAHGIRGDLVVEPITDEPAEVYSAGRRLFGGTAEGEPVPGHPAITVDGARTLPDGTLLVVFAELSDRTAAESWRGRLLLAPADELLPPAEDEFYVHQLIGMQVVLASGAPVGDVTDVFELPQGLVLELRRGAGTALLPFVDAFVHTVDVGGRRIVATPPEGLFE